MTDQMLLGRGHINQTRYGQGGPGRLLAGLSDAAWAVEERVVWGGADAARTAMDAVRWPFERLAWTLEQRLIWPLQDHASQWSEPLRIAAMSAVAAAAIAAGVGGLLLATPGNGDDSPTGSQAAAPTSLRVGPETSVHNPVTAGAVLHGATPIFKPATQAGTGAATGSRAGSSGADAAPGAAPAPPLGQPAGPAALKVAHRFAEAFVLYEIGKGNAATRAAFQATATPQLARSLLHRPPRLPANVKVPEAKVLNLVAGPSHGGVYTVSVSLLRVGVTSELRLDMQPQQGGASRGSRSARPGGRDWRVTT